MRINQFFSAVIQVIPGSEKKRHYNGVGLATYICRHNAMN